MFLVCIIIHYNLYVTFSGAETDTGLWTSLRSVQSQAGGIYINPLQCCQEKDGVAHFTGAHIGCVLSNLRGGNRIFISLNK